MVPTYANLISRRLMDILNRFIINLFRTNNGTLEMSTSNTKQASHGNFIDQFIIYVNNPKQEHGFCIII